jgi:hypothetical protein
MAVEPTRRSHAAIPLAIVVLFVGLYLGTITILAPALLGLVVLTTGASFLSAHINPFSMGFYLPRKPSWSAIGVLFLVAFVLLGAAYLYWLHGLGPIIPWMVGVTP